MKLPFSHSYFSTFLSPIPWIRARKESLIKKCPLINLTIYIKLKSPLRFQMTFSLDVLNILCPSTEKAFYVDWLRNIVLNTIIAKC